ncbi:MAG: lysogenization regulator HflD [Gammaproteobacteria bacterium]|nr:lysogenization regulator HflD [Gammaproteobacteria bacterium]
MSADSLQRPQLQTLTLSAVVQSAQLVRGLAHTGSAPFSAMKALIDPLFVLNAPSFTTIFPDLRLARPGLEWLTARPRQFSSGKNDEVLRYTSNLLVLRTKFMADTDMQLRLGRRLQSMSPLSAPNSDSHSQIKHPTELEGANETERSFEALATLYQDTISTLPFRIQVQGKVEHLQDERIVNRIRALLLAGIRFAVLWHQIGGRPWHLFILRGRINRIATSML